MRPGTPRARWAVIGVLALAAGPAVLAAAYVIPRAAWDTARVLWAALPAAAVVATWILVEIYGEEVPILPPHGVPSLLVGKAARGEGSAEPPGGPAPDAETEPRDDARGAPPLA
ncbi:MAG: hypothetical protein HZB56_21330 [Deltaproteobacteria bacterium]|nr:hypothetical protein [Deltaproteobacteria bacterium]